VQFRVGGDETLLKWAFKRNGKSQQISVNGRMTVNSTDFGIRAAVDGLGITYTLESMVEPLGSHRRLLSWDFKPSNEADVCDIKIRSASVGVGFCAAREFSVCRN
jgi:DNA-binding transcriptional LysR family regulator